MTTTEAEPFAAAFDPDQPRDKRGRWVRLGMFVRLPDGKAASVEGVRKDGKLSVRDRDTGKARVVSPGDVETERVGDKVQTTGKDEKQRVLNVEALRDAVAPKSTRKTGDIGKGFAVAGGSGDLETPLQQGLVQAVQKQQTRWVVPTNDGFALASTAPPPNTPHWRIDPDAGVYDVPAEKPWQLDQDPVRRLPDSDVARLVEPLRAAPAKVTSAGKAKAASRLKKGDAVEIDGQARKVTKVFTSPSLDYVRVFYDGGPDDGHKIPKGEKMTVLTADVDSAPVVDVEDGLDDAERRFVQRLANDPEALDALAAFGEDPSEENDRALDAALDRVLGPQTSGDDDEEEDGPVTAAGNAERLRRYWRREEGGAKIGWGAGGDFTRCVAQLSKYLGPGAKGYCAKRHREMTGMWPGDRRNASLAAAASLVQPPADWFTDPKLDAPTPMRITDDGRVFGHIAAWDTEHRGLPGVRPPRTASGYAEFLTHVRRVDSGEDVPVGSLTWGGGHADLTADANEARRHYDDTTTQVADVVVGEDEHGIWMAGALRPGLTDEQLVAVRGSAPSGDWRAVRGNLEMLAAHLVPVPGFPVPRQRSYSLAASGAAPFALVAAGAVLPADGERAALHRMVEEQNAVLAELRRDVTPLIAAARDEKVGKRRALVDRVRARISDVVKGPDARTRAVAEQAGVPDKVAAAVLAAVEAVDAARADRLAVLERAEVLTAGAALDGDRYPIRTKDDLRRAIQAFGRGAPEDRDRIKRHIIARARALGAVSELPDSWGVTASVDGAGLVAHLPGKHAQVRHGGDGIPAPPRRRKRSSSKADDFERAWQVTRQAREESARQDPSTMTPDVAARSGPGGRPMPGRYTSKDGATLDVAADGSGNLKEGSLPPERLTPAVVQVELRKTRWQSGRFAAR